MDTNLNKPYVSVIMPVYNCGDFIAESLESILDQTFEDFELIIIDDASTDNTLEVVKSYQDERIRLIKKDANTGYVDSLNLGITISKGKFLARMDGDDVSVRSRLEKQVNFLNENPDIALCGTWYQLLPSKEIIQHPAENEEIKLALLEYCALGHPTVMFRKSFIDTYKLAYKPEFRPAEDYELWTRISAVGKMANIPEVLLHYRSHQGQISIHEKDKQISNSLFCKTRMLCYPLAKLNDSDLQLGVIVSADEKIDRSGLLAEVTDWLDRICEANLSSSFYEFSRFKDYIEMKKAGLIRSFYLNITPYHPGVLIQFLKLQGKFSKYFSVRELLKLALKCVVFWKPGVKISWVKN